MGNTISGNYAYAPAPTVEIEDSIPTPKVNAEDGIYIEGYNTLVPTKNPNYEIETKKKN